MTAQRKRPQPRLKIIACHAPSRPPIADLALHGMRVVLLRAQRQTGLICACLPFLSILARFSASYRFWLFSRPVCPGMSARTDKRLAAPPAVIVDRAAGHPQRAGTTPHRDGVPATKSRSLFQR